MSTKETEHQVLGELVADLIKERRATRRMRYIKYGLFAVIAVALDIAVFSSATGQFGGDDSKDKEITAAVNVYGEISEGGQASAEVIKKGLRQALEDKRTKAVVLRINSPGGSPVQAGEVYDEIKRQRELHKDTKIYAVISDLGASGAYYIASAADEIYANKSSLVGSIGVTAASFGYVDLMRTLGVERRAYTSGEHKAFLDPFQPQNQEEAAFWSSVLKTTHAQFIKAVVDGRGPKLKVSEHPELFSGLIWSGEQALQLGLVDRLADVDYVAREVVGASHVVDFTAKENPFDRFAKKIGASVAEHVSITMGFSGPNLR